MHTTKARKHRDGYIRVTFGEHKIGTQAPYWSVTADISSSPKFTDRSIHSCGCLHEDVAEYFPELAHTIKWHLSTAGVPMHYIANAQYWHDMYNGKVSRGQYDPEPAKTFTHHVIQLNGEEASAWLVQHWEHCQTILTDRIPTLQAAYQADVRDQLGALETL